MVEVKVLLQLANLTLDPDATPILINCVKCSNLCVLRWLMFPIVALNCLLQIEQERSEEESSVVMP